MAKMFPVIAMICLGCIGCRFHAQPTGALPAATEPPATEPPATEPAAIEPAPEIYSVSADLLGRRCRVELVDSATTYRTFEGVVKEVDDDDIVLSDASAVGRVETTIPIAKLFPFLRPMFKNTAIRSFKVEEDITLARTDIKHLEPIEVGSALADDSQHNRLQPESSRPDAAYQP